MMEHEEEGLAGVRNLRFSYEADLVAGIRERFGGLLAHRGEEARFNLEARRRHLLGNATCVTPELLPAVHEAFEKSLQLLGFAGRQGALFVQQSSDYNASVLSDGHRFDVVVNSSLVKDFSTDELRFVLGHELGHVVFGHSGISVDEIFQKDDAIQPAEALMLFSWSRAAEISADRVGLFCAGNLMTATSALFKTSSGLSGIEPKAILRSFRQQYDELKAHIETVGGGYGWARTHPLMAIRFKALELAALDIVALGSGSLNFNADGFRRLDREIAQVLRDLESPSAPTRGLSSTQGQVLLFAALLYVGTASGALSWDQRWALHDIHQALRSELSVQTLIDAATEDLNAFRGSVLEEIARDRSVLSEGDKRCVVGMAGLVMSLAGGTTTPWPESLVQVTQTLGLEPNLELETWKPGEAVNVQVARMLATR